MSTTKRNSVFFFRTHTLVRSAFGTVMLVMTFVAAWHSACRGEAAETRAPLRDDQHVVRKHVCSWTELQRRNVVMQQRDFSCGAAALATVLRYQWNDTVDEDEILHALDSLLTKEEVQDRIKNGLALTDLRRVAVKLGYLATIGKSRLDQLTKARIPLIVGIKVGQYDHFVVYRGGDRQFSYLADPARGNLRLPTAQFVKQWQKQLVLVVIKADAAPTGSPLAVRPSAQRLGHLNDHVVRRVFTRPPQLSSAARYP